MKLVKDGALKKTLIDCFKCIANVNELSENVSDGVKYAMFSHIDDAEYINDVFEIEDLSLKEMFLKYKSVYYNLV